LDVSPHHMYTCPNPWLLIEHKPMSFGGQSQVLALNDTVSHPRRLVFLV